MGYNLCKKLLIKLNHENNWARRKISFDVPEYTADITGLGTLRILVMKE